MKKVITGTLMGVVENQTGVRLDVQTKAMIPAKLATPDSPTAYPAVRAEGVSLTTGTHDLLSGFSRTKKVVITIEEVDE